MKTMPARRLPFLAAVAIATILGTQLGPAAATAGAKAVRSRAQRAAPSSYVADFVAAVATGVAMNDAGDITGTAYRDTGCGSRCLPPLDTVVFRGSERIILPEVPGLTGITVRSINSQGWVAGWAGFPYTVTHAVVWKPVGSTYQAIDLGNLPGKTISEAIGIDNLGRVVGWSTTQEFPPQGAPFMWTESGGMVDLSAQGFPTDKPLAISPGGAVATASFWYRLGDPASVVSMPTTPVGFTLGADATAINDAGDQARFLISTSGQYRYLFRFHHEGTYQQISFIALGSVSYGVGSITAAGDITATVLGEGVVAFGPDGLSQPLIDLLSPAYDSGGITNGGPMNASGQILAQVFIGLSPRLMRLVPAEPCTGSCLKVGSLVVGAKFIPDPHDPGSCTPAAKNQGGAKVTITSLTGQRAAGVLVNGRFLDEYWASVPVSGTTDSQGLVKLSNIGPCGVGAIAFLVESVSGKPAPLDRTVGTLSGWAIPQT